MDEKKPRRYRPSSPQTRNTAPGTKEALSCVIAFCVCAAVTVGGAAWATVACGSGDATNFELTSVRKAGQEQPLPTFRSGSIGNNFGVAYVYDPDVAAFRQLLVEWLP